jgi:hypothetical protein
MGRRIAIGCGSAYAEDRFENAVALAESGLVDYLGFDCLAERTLALAQIRRLADPAAGQDRRIPAMMDLFAPFVKRGGRITGNFGAANIDAALSEVMAGLRRNQLTGVRVGVVRGDDVLDQVRKRDLPLDELGKRPSDLGDRLVSAHAYIGADPLVEALDAGASIVFGGRIADPSLFVAPICHELGWGLDDWDHVSAATLAGHLLECGIHGTGGNFEDPPLRVVENPHDLAMPVALVTPERTEITKLDGTGGAIDERVIKTQLAYEIHDPERYLTPDVTANFRHVTVAQVGHNRVEVCGARGADRPERLKVMVGVDFGYKITGEVSYGGPNCIARAQRGAEILARRLEPFAHAIDEQRTDLLGVSALFQDRLTRGYPAEVRLRFAARCADKTAADAIANEFGYVWFGPAGAGGLTASVVPAVGVTPAFLDRDDVSLQCEVVVS